MTALWGTSDPKANFSHFGMDAREREIIAGATGARTGRPGSP
jgi:hypothetical protein